MNADQWHKVAEIYSSALELSPEERLDYISQRCGGDEVLESSLRRMLEAEDLTEGFLDRPLSIIGELLPDAMGNMEILQPGEILSKRFEIQRFLARGGMGEVYQALDRVLHEPAAIKTIRPEIAGRREVVDLFRQEVSRARAIRSDHVCPVFDVFEDETFDPPLVFLSMKLLEGETLRERIEREGRLAPKLVAALLTEIASGVAAAHRADIIHGDLKSGNVMLEQTHRSGLRATVTDFGLARNAAEGTDRTEGEVSAAAIAIGTPEYMAPEQLAGGPSTRLSDVYSLGVLTFEMVTGRLPFPRLETDAGAGTRTHPPSVREFAPDCPARLERIILKCLAPRPEDRFHSAEAVIDSLRSNPLLRLRNIALLFFVFLACVWLAWQYGLKTPRHTVYAPRNSLAVLPFSSPEVEGVDYFGDGFTEDLIRSLTRSSDLKVVGTESVLRMRDTPLSPREIGDRLGVQYLVLGKVRYSDTGIAILAKLIRASDGAQLWSEEYERKDRQTSAIRHQIATQIASKLQVSLAGMQADGAGSTANLQAQDLYWMGRHHWRQRSDAGVRKSVEFFEQATHRDPSFAAGWSGLADAYAVMAERQMVPPVEGLSNAENAAKRAVALDARLPEAWCSLGQVQSIYKRDFAAAEESFRRAIALQPGFAPAHQWYSYMLAKQRRFSEAVQHARQAVMLDPISIPANINLTVILYYARHDEEAIVQGRKLSHLDPSILAGRLVTAQVLARHGRFDEAFSEMEQVSQPGQTHPLTVRFWAELCAIAGKRQEAEEAISRLIQMRPQGLVPAFFVASAWATLGEKDRAFEWLEIACKEQDGIVSMVHAAPGFDGLRMDPRYAGILQHVGLRAGM